MANRYLRYPAILVDLNKARLRIYKNAFHAIGDPDYIVLVVNPFAKTLTITCSDKSDQRAYYLTRTPYDNNRSPEIFCRALIRSLYSLNDNWDKLRLYRIYGTVSLSGRDVVFSLSDATVFMGESEWL